MKKYLTAVLSLTLVGCGSAPLGFSSQTDDALTADYNTCNDATPPLPLVQGFEHRINRRQAVAQPRHGIVDVVATPGSSVTFTPLFSYGAFDALLRDETVRLSLYDCSGWTPQGEASTDLTGRTHMPMDTQALGAGTYRVAHTVAGDGSMVVSDLYLLPAGTQMVVFDIDGTLTTHDRDLIRDVVYERFTHRAWHPQPYRDAAAVTRAWHDKGYVVVYLTARPLPLRDMTEAWLRNNNFAPGPLHLAENRHEWALNSRAAGAYKHAYLQNLRAQGYALVAGYGNAEHDLRAYAAANVETIYKVGRAPVASPVGKAQLLRGYSEHLPELGNLGAARQPYDGVESAALLVPSPS